MSDNKKIGIYLKSDKAVKQKRIFQSKHVLSNAREKADPYPKSSNRKNAERKQSKPISSLDILNRYLSSKEIYPKQLAKNESSHKSNSFESAKVEEPKKQNDKALQNKNDDLKLENRIDLVNFFSQPFKNTPYSHNNQFKVLQSQLRDVYLINLPNRNEKSKEDHVYPTNVISNQTQTEFSEEFDL